MLFDLLVDEVLENVLKVAAQLLLFASRNLDWDPLKQFCLEAMTISQYLCRSICEIRLQLLHPFHKDP